MTTTTIPEFDPVYEIIGLLGTSYNPEYLDREQFIKEWRELFGQDTAEVYDKFLPVVKRYLKTFEKHSVRTPATDFLFSSAHENWYAILLGVFLQNPQWPDHPEQLTGDQLTAGLLAQILPEADRPDTGDMPGIIRALARQGELDADTCWRLTQVLQDPVAHFSGLIDAVRRNRDAYRLAMASVEKSLTKPLAAFSRFDFSQVLKLNVDIEVRPTLIAPVSYYVNACLGVARGGLYLPDVFARGRGPGGQQADRHLLSALKALSDGSKFKILCSLRKSPKYNLELAEELGLSAATVSHHMGMLLTSGLVAVEKHGGKVYYTLQRDAVEEMLDQLRLQLLE